MSRDAYSHEPPDPRDTPRASASRSRTAGEPSTREARERAVGDARPESSRERSRGPALKPERLDTPRAYSERGRLYLLRDSEVRALAETGTFRVVPPSDLAKYAYDGDGARMERDLRRLKRAGLVTDRTIEASRKTKVRILTLTKRGERVLHHTNRLPREQVTYHGLVKPKEAEHDAALYRLYQKEAARIEGAGGRPARVILDYELKRDLNRELARLPGEDEDSTERPHIADRHGLRMVEGRIQVPDLRVEYETADLEPRHIDLDLVTRDYRPGQISAKAQAGFSLYSDDAPRLRRILHDRDLTAEILSL